MATPNIVPRADSEGGLGTASKYWASAYIDTITTTSHVNLPDSAELRLGTGNDFRLYHNGNDSYVNNGTGSLYIKSTTSDSDIIFQGSDGGSSITALTLDMSSAGHATFNSKITTGDDLFTPQNKGIFFNGGGQFNSGVAGSDSGESTRIFAGSAERFKVAETAITVQSIPISGATSYNGIPFFSDGTSMYTHDVSGNTSYANADNNTAYGFNSFRMLLLQEIITLL